MKNPINKKLNIIIALLVILIISVIGGLVCLVPSLNYRLMSRVYSWLHDKKVPYTHNNIYTDGVQGILDDIEERIHLPETLYISNAQTIDYDVDGTVTGIYMLLYGVQNNGRRGTWLVHYTADSSENRQAYAEDGSGGNLTVTVSSSRNGEPGQDTMLLQPMLDLTEALDLQSLSRWYAALSYSNSLELTYWGYREMDVNSYTYCVTMPDTGGSSHSTDTLLGIDGAGAADDRAVSSADTAGTGSRDLLGITGPAGSTDSDDSTTAGTSSIWNGVAAAGTAGHASLQPIDRTHVYTYVGYEVSLSAPDTECTPARYFADTGWLNARDYVDPDADAQERHDDALDAVRSNEGLQGSGYLDTTNGSMYCYVSDEIGYHLFVADAAAGSRFYQLEMTTDGGATWTLQNRDPFLGLIGVVGGMQFEDELHGEIRLDSPSGGIKEICRTEDGGVTFTAVEDSAVWDMSANQPW